MDDEEEFVKFVMSRPEYYHISKSKIFLQLIDFLSSGAKSTQVVYQQFTNIEAQDLDQMLDTLVAVGLADKIFAASNVLFFATPDAKILIEKIKKAKKQLLL